MLRVAPIAAALGLLLTVGPSLSWAQDPAVEAATPPRSPGRAAGPWLLDESFPIEVAITAHAGLLHWLDSLTAMNDKGMTAGKSIEAHRAEYNKRLGQPTREDQQVLLRYVEARKASVTHNNVGDPDALTTAFFQAGSMSEALDALPALLDAGTAAELRQILQHFAPRYQKIWDGGQVPRSFVQRVRQDPRRVAVAGFMVDVARFYGVAPVTDPPPRLQLMPVIDGHGTHAQAIGRHMLVEVRDWEGLSEQLGPLVHENAHLFFDRVAPERVAALRATALAGEHGAAAWDALREALPTALAQGVACERFGVPSWSKAEPWYHHEEIDAYAKNLFDLVKSTLATGGTLDEAFVRRAVGLYKRHLPEGAGR